MQTEADIIRGCIQNSSASQQLLYIRYAPILKSVCARYIANKEEAKDVLHDSFIKIFKVINKYKGEGSFEGWLKRIAINVAIDHLKKVKKEGISNFDNLTVFEDSSIDEEKFNHSEALLNSGFTAEDLLEIIHKIQSEYSSVFNMFYVDQLSHKEIAISLNIDENTSRTRLFRARALIKKELQKEIRIRKC